MVTNRSRNSSYTAGLIRGLHDRPVEIIPFGASVPVPPDIPPRPPSRPFRLLFVGRLVERKGVAYLLEALSLVRDRVEVELEVVGEGPLRSALEEEARRLDLGEAVEFRGFVSREELSRSYAGCHAFVLPAVVDAKGDVEGLGVVLIEALAHGRPAIGSEAGGIVDIVRPGETGLLVPPGDGRALAAAILELAEDPSRAEQLGRQGRAYVQRRFGWTEVTDTLVGLYERLTGDRGGDVSGPLSGARR